MIMVDSGIVQSISGVVKAVAGDGTERILQVGDRVLPNEQIVTGDAGTIIMGFSDGTSMDLGRNASVTLNDDSFYPDSGTPQQVGQTLDDAQDEVAAIQQALLEGKILDASILPAPAAGGLPVANGSGEDDGYAVVNIDYMDPRQTPGSGFETKGINVSFSEIHEELLLQPDESDTRTVGATTLLPDDDDKPSISGQEVQLLQESFENFRDARGWHIEGEGGASIVGDHDVVWVVNEAGLEIQRGNIGGSTASDGDSHVELDTHDSNHDGGTTLTVLSTQVNIPAGEATLTFDYKPRPADPAGSDMKVTFAGKEVLLDGQADGSVIISAASGVTVIQTSGSTGWISVALGFAGLVASEVALSFEGLPDAGGDSNSLGAYLDNINLMANSLQVDETTLNGNDTADFSGQFVAEFGADGPGGMAYALTLNSGDTGVNDSATGEAVVLFLNSGVIEGRTEHGGELVFTVSVDNAGLATLDQIRSVIHTDENDHDSVVGLNADLINLEAVITDFDGDFAATSIDLGAAISFRDDGPEAEGFQLSTADSTSSSNIDFLGHVDVGADLADDVIRIINGPEKGTLRDSEGNTVSDGDLYGINELSYDAENTDFQTITLGARDGSATLANWGVTSGSLGGSVTMDGITATIAFTDNDNNASSQLIIYNNNASHIGGGGFADNDGKGINNGEILSVTFDKLMQYAEIGIDGMGNHFLPNASQQAHATWIAYQGNDEVARGEIDNPEGQNEGFEGLQEIFTISIDEGFDRIELGNNSNNAGSNYEIRFIEAEAKITDSFDYEVVDGDFDSMAATVDVVVTPGGVATQEIDYFIADEAQVSDDVFRYTKDLIDTTRVENDIVENFDIDQDILDLADLLSDGSHTVEGISTGADNHLQISIKDGDGMQVQIIELNGVGAGVNPVDTLNTLLDNGSINDGII